jgi:hypothetical protein
MEKAAAFWNGTPRSFVNTYRRFRRTSCDIFRLQEQSSHQPTKLIIKSRYFATYQVVDGRIILKWIFKNWDGSMDWIELDQNRDRWWALVNAVMNLRVP